jgi:hypothetical protein
MISGPAGMRCMECALPEIAARTYSDPRSLLAGALVSVGAAVMGAFVLKLLGVFACVAGPFYGALVARAVIQTTGIRGSQKMAIAGSAAIFVGVLLSCVGPFGHSVVSPLGMSPAVQEPLLGVGFGLAIATCYDRLKAS